jgi:ABC-type multidrug transport system fused ATPase/permease subunit
MDKQHRYTRITRWVSRFIAILLVILIFCLPSILDWYIQFRTMTDLAKTAVTAAFYACVGIIFVALWNVDKLLESILQENVFTRENVRRIRRICYCCGGVGLVCVPATVAYLPLIFLVIIMGFLCLMVSVVANVMDTAVALREENDLTI